MNEVHQLGSEGAEDWGLVGKQCFGVSETLKLVKLYIIKTHFTTLIDTIAIVSKCTTIAKKMKNNVELQHFIRSSLGFKDNYRTNKSYSFLLGLQTCTYKAMKLIIIWIKL